MSCPILHIAQLLSVPSTALMLTGPTHTHTPPAISHKPSITTKGRPHRTVPYHTSPWHAPPFLAVTQLHAAANNGRGHTNTASQRPSCTTHDALPVPGKERAVSITDHNILYASTCPCTWDHTNTHI